MYDTAVEFTSRTCLPKSRASRARDANGVRQTRAWYIRGNDRARGNPFARIAAVSPAPPRSAARRHERLCVRLVASEIREVNARGTINLSDYIFYNADYVRVGSWNDTRHRDQRLKKKYAHGGWSVHRLR